MHKVLAQIKTPYGFTLVELILAIVIVVILTTIGIASFNSASKTNAVSQQAQEIKSLARKLRTDATAAIKPAGDCSLPANSAVVYGSYLYFKGGASNYYYGTACFNPTTALSYSSVKQGNLKTPLTFTGLGGDYKALLYTFNGHVITYTFPDPGTDPVITAAEFGLSELLNTTNIKITDGTASRDYRINFSATGLVCEEKASIPAFCAEP